VADSRESRTATAIDAYAESEASGDALTAREAVSQTSSDEPVSVELIEETVDIEAVLRDVRAEAAAGALQPHRAPLLAELSQQFRDAVPTIMYLRHDFNPGGVSTVLMNGETLRVGGRTRGVELREILPESAVLRFQGQEFRLRALNSWVNL
ncbi:MAG: general secretion pathway protein GspB, partial [Pseudomonadota bacterium]